MASRTPNVQVSGELMPQKRTVALWICRSKELKFRGKSPDMRGCLSSFFPIAGGGLRVSEPGRKTPLSIPLEPLTAEGREKGTRWGVRGRKMVSWESELDRAGWNWWRIVSI